MSNQYSEVGGLCLSNIRLPPHMDCVKSNSYGSFKLQANCMGGGAVIRNDKGHWVVRFASFTIRGNPFF